MAKSDRSFVFRCPECEDELHGSVTTNDVLGIPKSSEPGWHLKKYGKDLPLDEWEVEHVCKNDGRGRLAKLVG
jgi:hypothetical protein